MIIRPVPLQLFADSIAGWYNADDRRLDVSPAIMEDPERPMRVLVVDDDPPSVKMISFLLREEGYDVVTASNGPEALRLVDEAAPDLVILDVMMPHMDGLEVCQRIRQHTDLPIIFLSAKGETVDRVTGLNLGADDYLPKPFEPAELLARVRAVMRRAEGFAPGEPRTLLEVNGFRLDPVNNRVTLPDGRAVDLTPIEFRLLYTLARHKGRILSHEQLLNAVWGYDYQGDSNHVAVYVRRLRAKIEPDPEHPRYLLTARGVGYKFECD